MVKSTMIKIFKLIWIIIGALAIIITIFSFAIQLIFREQLTKYLIDELNKRVEAKIDVQNTDLSFWKTFPNIAVSFNNVILHPSNKFCNINNSYNDTLLISDQVFFEFNVIKLLSKNYVLNKIRIQNGSIYLKIGENGVLNYDIFKKGGGTGTQLTLKNIVLRRCSIQYLNYNSNVFIKSYTNRSNIGAIFNNGSAGFTIHTSLFIYSLAVNNNIYAENIPFEAIGYLKVQNNIYQFNNVDFKLDNLDFLFKGEYVSGNPDKINFIITGHNLNLNQFENIIPKQYNVIPDTYKIKGKFDISVSINGNINKLSNPLLHIKCKIKNAEIIETISKLKFEELYTDLTLTNGLGKSLQTSIIQINNFKSKFNTGYISGDGSYANFTQPLLKINGNTQLDINELKKFLHLDTFEIFTGMLKGNFSFEGKLKNAKKINIKNFDITSLVSDFQINNANLKFKNSTYSLSNINGNIKLQDDINFNNFTFKFNDFDIKLDGKLINGLTYLFGKTEVTDLEAEVFSPYLDLSGYFTTNSRSSNVAQPREFLFPSSLNLNLNIRINEFKLNKFKAKWIKGNLLYKPTMFILKSISLETLEGSLKGNGVIAQNYDKRFLIRGQADLSKINIQQAFYTFNNFSQDILKENHIRGHLSGKVSFTSEWDSQLKLIPDNLLVDAGITIQNGELLNFEPMSGLSKFISLEELQNIRFSTLKNTIYIKDKQIIIPEMDINSSAFNISGSGVHQFDNHYNYKVRILLSEFLYGKAKKAKKENEEYGRIEDDGLGRTSIYLNIEGFNKDYKISYDSRKTIDIVKESLVKQKMELKEIFREEFGWFKNDTIPDIKKKKTNAVQVQFDDEIDNAKAQQVTPGDKKEKKKEKTEKVEVEWE